MERFELVNYEQCSVRIDYSTEIAEQSRTGIIYAVTQDLVVFWPFEQEKEIRIPLADVKNIKRLKDIDLEPF